MYRSTGAYGSFPGDSRSPYDAQDSVARVSAGAGRYGAPLSDAARLGVTSYPSFSGQSDYASDASYGMGGTTASPRMGTREKKYACQQCHKRFERPSAVVTHMRSHTGEKPYGCSFCDKSFSINSNRIRHERTFHAHVNPGTAPALQPEEGEFEEEPTSRRLTAPAGLGINTNGGSNFPTRAAYGNSGRVQDPTAASGYAGSGYSCPSTGNLSGGGGGYSGYTGDSTQLRGGRLDFTASMTSSGDYSSRRSEYAVDPRPRGYSGSSYGASDYDPRESTSVTAGEITGTRTGRPGSSSSFGYASDPSSTEFSPTVRDLGGSPNGSGLYGSPTGFGPQSYDSGSSGIGAPYGIGAATSNVRGSYRSSAEDYPESLCAPSQGYYSRLAPIYR